MGRDLEDGVGGGVDDPLPRSLVLFPQLLDDLGPGGGLVAEDAATRAVHEGIDDLEWEAVRIRWHRLRRHDAHELPVAGCRVLAARPFDQAARDRGSAGLRRTALQRLDVSKPER